MSVVSEFNENEKNMLKRCPWAESDPLYQKYHDTEWGDPIHDEQKLFEFLILEGAQAGLSWITILKKRDAYQKAFEDFNPEKVALFDQVKIDQLLQNPGIIRNKLKINSTVINAQRFLEIQDKFGSFDAFIWNFVDGKPIVNTWKTLAEVPAETKLSTSMSKALKKEGFKFVGPTICYSFMQACGLVNDHLTDCFKHP